jgi:hypothetical protein
MRHNLHIPYVFIFLYPVFTSSFKSLNLWNSLLPIVVSYTSRRTSRSYLYILTIWNLRTCLSSVIGDIFCIPSKKNSLEFQIIYEYTPPVPSVEFISDIARRIVNKVSYSYLNVLESDTCTWLIIYAAILVHICSKKSLFCFQNKFARILESGNRTILTFTRKNSPSEEKYILFIIIHYLDSYYSVGPTI